MFCVVYNPKINRETLAEFNRRVDEICTDHPIVKISQSCIGSALLLSLTSADDLDAIDQPTVVVAVRAIDTSDKAKSAELEETIDRVINGENDKHTDDNPRVPVEATLVPRQDDPDKGYLVLLMINGMAEDDGGDDEGGDDEESEGDEPPGGNDNEGSIPIRTAEVMPR